MGSRTSAEFLAAPIRCGGIVSGPSDSRKGWVRGGGSGQWVGFAGPRLGVPPWCWEYCCGSGDGVGLVLPRRVGLHSCRVASRSYPGEAVSCLRPVFGRPVLWNVQVRYASHVPVLQSVVAVSAVMLVFHPHARVCL